MSEPSLTTRVSRFNRIWICRLCGWRAYISRGKHSQTGQPLTRAEQIATLRHQASKHFREQHRADFTK